MGGCSSAWPMAAASPRFPWLRQPMSGKIIPVVSEAHVVFAFAGIVITSAHLLGLVLIADSHLRECRRTALGNAPAECFDVDEIHGDGGIRGLGIRHRQRPLVELPLARRWSEPWDLGPTQLISALGVGLIAVFWAYDGWVYITWVAGEVKEPRRNVPLAMVLGVLAVGVDLRRDEPDVRVCATAEGNRRARDHRACGSDRVVFSAGRGVACR